jgi:hypothetical protein
MTRWYPPLRGNDDFVFCGIFKHPTSNQGAR